MGLPPRCVAPPVSANFAEGCGRMGDIELRRFVRISLGSLSELECELLIATNLELITSELSHELSLKIGSVRGMLQRLHRALPPHKASARPRPSIPRPRPTKPSSTAYPSPARST